MAIDEQDDINPDIIPNDLFDDELDDDWFNITDVVDIYIDKDEY